MDKNTNRRLTFRAYFLLSILIFWGFDHTPPEKKGVKPYNVLFISVDDLNDWLGYLGNPNVITPNFDELAHRGVYFTKAYCAAPLCSPSRASLWTGKYPFHTGIYSNHDVLESRKDLPTIPKAFKQEGYTVLGAGKLFHGRSAYSNSQFDILGPDTGVSGGPFVDGEINSSLQNPTHHVDRGPGRLNVVLPLNGMKNDRPYNKYNTFDWGPLDVTDDEMPDGKIANWAIEQLQKDNLGPFFLGVGFFRPHQPLFAPKKYHDLYPPQDIKLPQERSDDLEDLSQTGKDFALLAGTSGTHATVLEHDQWKEAVSSYMASISFVDAQLGKIIQALDNSQHAKNTMIVLFSDHGWHVGEKQHWGKWTGWNRSQRIPLIIVPPQDMTLDGFVPGTESKELVSLIDILPTLLELHSNVDIGQYSPDGISLWPFLKKKADLASGTEKRNHIISTFGRGNNVIIDNNWHYIHYFDGSEELYRMDNDPKQLNNLALDPAYNTIKSDFRTKLPQYPEIKHFVRMGPWKAIIYHDKNKEDLLFNIYGKSGIMEAKNLRGERPDIHEKILKLLEQKDHPGKFMDLTGNR